ncbi:unnamed protein product, partial [Discosporangium mesarthrocarpum]
FEEADPLYARAVDIGERTLEPNDPDLAVWMNNRAVTLRHQGRLDEAEPLLARAVEIWETALGCDHPEVAKGLNNWAELLKAK